MAKTVVIDELHLTCRIPRDLPDDRADAIRRTLAGKAFMSRLRRAARSVVREFSQLGDVRVALAR